MAKVKVAKKGNTTMFIQTLHLRFLDIVNYIGPGISYDAWTKAYGCGREKLWLPYEWFDSVDKLDYPGLPDYPAWHSKMKGAFVLSLEQWKKCKQLLKEKGMKTFTDWLRYYNDLDVAPGLEALEKMRGFYTEKGIDILKDAVGIPGVNFHYLLKGTIERGAEPYSPNKEAYEMLKGAVVGEPSIVSTRAYEVGITKLRVHQVNKPGFASESLVTILMASTYPPCLEKCPAGRKRSFTTAILCEQREGWHNA